VRHAVSVGETPDAIAIAYGCDPLDLVLANRHKRWQRLPSGVLTFADLTEGEVLELPRELEHDLSPGMMGAPGVPDIANFVPVPSQFGPAANQIQADAQNQLLQAENYVQGHAKDTLGQLAATAGVTPEDLSSAVAAYNQYGAKAVASLVSLANGSQAPSASAFAPLIGFGLTLAGAVPLVGIAVTAALAIFDTLSQALNNALDGPPCGSNPAHQWTLPGGMCISRDTGRPGGPESPDWVGWPAFEATQLASAAEKANGQAWPPQNIGGPTPVGKWLMGLAGISIDTAFPQYAETIGCEMDALGPAPLLGQGHSVADFFRAYYRAWQHTAEWSINGYAIQQLSPWALFAKTQLAWNAAHTGPSVALIATPYPSHYASGACISYGAPNDPGSVSYIGALLNGDIDGQNHLDKTPQLNIGPSNQSASLANLITSASGSTSSSSSAGKKVAVAAGVGGVALAALWLALGRPLSWAAFKAAFGHAWRNV
jgi:hypothetical protein